MLQWLLTTVVDRVQHSIVDSTCSTTLQQVVATLIKLLIFPRVVVESGAEQRFGGLCTVSKVTTAHEAQILILFFKYNCLYS